MKSAKVTGLILMIVLLYPLSYGLAARIVSHPRITLTSASKRRLILLYDPLMRVPMLCDFLNWYAYLWIRDLGPCSP